MRAADVGTQDAARGVPEGAAGLGPREEVPRRRGGVRAAKRPPLPLGEVCEGMVVRRVDVAPADVVFVKGVVEASDGLGAVFADAGGALTIAAPRGREAELTRLLDDLRRECGASWTEPADTSRSAARPNEPGDA
ncbi:MAG: DUF4911 domain-containing protein [Polyangiaceae bacterium]